MKYLSLAVIILIGWSCSTTKQTTVAVTPDVEEEFLDTLYITADDVTDEEISIDGSPVAEEMANDLPIYRETARRYVDILHTNLDLSFDIPNEKVMGIATLTVKPINRPLNKVVLDATHFTINSIKDWQRNTLNYTNDGQQLTIDLSHEIKGDQEVILIIDYIAHPGSGEAGGSAAITSDRGLFFIDPKNEDPEKPTQIWTQGETESNSRWFPTVDKPNERCTQEMYITVDDSYETLSNGSLLSSTKNSDGTRTDYWKMDLPHAPYLFMLAVGDFAVAKETWRGKELSYYVEPEYAESAKDIFNHTPEILTLFSDLFKVEYPWPKLGQIVVRDYVSGAMENTTGIIYGDFIQHHKRGLIDNHNDRIVAHEILHHWFGDMVTCESWSNLTMNEGFANYGEYLWFEHKYGRDAADFHRMNEQAGYLNSAVQGGIRNLIDFQYESRENMFDAHSYNKGGLVLHSLRKYLGDEIFFDGLHIYLTDNAYTAVEAHDLRLAMEEASGEDLNWFWNQWFFGAGHPSLEVNKEYNPETSILTLNFTQSQEPVDGQSTIFELPLDVDIYQEGKPVRRERLHINQRNQTFILETDSEPLLVNVDATKSHIGYLTYDKSDDEYAYQFANAPLFVDRFEALQKLSGTSHPQKHQIMEKALDDPFWFIRSFALDRVSTADNPALVSQIRNMAGDDKRSQVRVKALNIIGELSDTTDVGLYEKIIQSQLAYPVIGAALVNLNNVDPDKALAHANRLKAQNDAELITPVAQVYASQGSLDYLPFFKENAETSSGFQSLDFLEVFAHYVSKLPGESLTDQIGFISDMAFASDHDQWKKLALYKTLLDIKTYISPVSEMGSAIKLIDGHVTKLTETETNPILQNYYKQFQQ